MPPASPPFAHRLNQLSNALAAREFHAAVLPPGPDMAYLLGSSVSSHERFTCLIAPVDGVPVLLVPELERLGWAGSWAEEVVSIATWFDGAEPHVFASGLLPPQVEHIAVGDAMPAGHALRLRDALPGVTMSLAGEAVASLRVIKDDIEIAALAAAAAAVDRVHKRMAEWLRPGRTENEVAKDISCALVEEGHSRAEFVIVGSGPNGASPHHSASDRVLEAGDAVVVDIGGPVTAAGYGDYFSDCTRTYQLAGQADLDFETVYEVVLQAQQAAMAAVRPGVAASTIDATARGIIDDAGWGRYFITRTGHGIGLEVHEHPYIVAGNDDVLEPGMTFSIEPGIYLPGRFGVRIEDIVVVTDEGCESLNDCSRQLRVL
jgi:Xaa-Pro aminopeptidase